MTKSNIFNEKLLRHILKFWRLQISWYLENKLTVQTGSECPDLLKILKENKNGIWELSIILGYFVIAIVIICIHRVCPKLLSQKKRHCNSWRLFHLVAQMVQNQPAMQETQVRSLGQEDSLEKGMAIHSSILAERIPWTEEFGGLQSIGSHRVGHDWSDLARTLDWPNGFVLVSILVFLSFNLSKNLILFFTHTNMHRSNNH